MSETPTTARNDELLERECFYCKRAGFPNTMVLLESAGKGQDGKTIWNMYEQDGSKHEHKGSYEPKTVKVPTAELKQIIQKLDLILEKLVILEGQKRL
jgi:hypothetical protein